MTALVALAFEGFICIAMAFPLLVVTTFLGALLGYWLQRFRRRKGPVTLCLAFVSPLSMMGEQSLDLTPPPIEVVTVTTVQMPSEELWSALIGPTNLGLSAQSIGRIGVTVPTRIELVISKGKRILDCQTTNGDIPLRVLSYIEGEKISFSPIPPVVPMKELSPYEWIDAPHLDGYFIVEQGTIEFERVGRNTQVRATTRLRHNIWPAAYWALFTRPIINTMHEQVIRALTRAAQERNGS